MRHPEFAAPLLALTAAACASQTQERRGPVVVSPAHTDTRAEIDDSHAVRAFRNAMAIKPCHLTLFWDEREFRLRANLEPLPELRLIFNQHIQECLAGRMGPSVNVHPLFQCLATRRALMDLMGDDYCSEDDLRMFRALLLSFTEQCPPVFDENARAYDGFPIARHDATGIQLRKRARCINVRDR